MNKKKIVSLGIAAVFMALGTTGLLLYLVQHNKPTKVIHTTFGLFFVAVAVFHIINNWGSLVSYMKERGVFKLNREFMLVFTITTASVIGAGMLWPPFEFIEEFGEGLRKGNQKPVPKVVFSKLTVGDLSTGSPLTVMIEKDKETLLPVVGVWAEDSAGNVVEDLFIPSAMTQVFEDEKGNEEHAIREGEVEQVTLSESALPSRRAKSSLNSNFEGATPNENIMLLAAPKTSPPFTLKLEVTSLGKSELYSGTIDTKGTLVRLQPIGEGKMLKAYAGLENN